MSYTQRQLVGWVITDSGNGIAVRNLETYAVVGRVSPVSVRYQGLNVVVQDTKAFRLRSQQAFVATKAPALGQVRQIAGYALTKAPAQGQVRQAVAYALVVAAQPVVKTKTGLAAFYDMLNANRKDLTITWSAANLSVGVPFAANVDDKNTGVRITDLAQNGYSGWANVYYNRIPFVRLFTSTNLQITINSATTLRALIPAINTAYGTFLVPEDVVDGPVPANAAGVRLTAADGSIMWQPGTFVALGTDPGPFNPTLADVVLVRSMSGFEPA